MANVVDKYFNKKKKEMLEYSKIINELLEYDNNQIWTNDSEFNNLMKQTLNNYVDNYYFDSMEDFSEYEEYLGALVKCDNKFKTILVCAINSIPDELKKGNYKISAYIIALIAYTSIALNRFTYPYNNYKVTITNIFTIVESMFKNIDFMKYKEDTKLRKELYTLIKKNDTSESKFFECLNSLNTDISKNVYKNVDTNGKYYKVKYKYNIPEFKNYRDRDVKKFFKRIEDDLNVLSYELCTISILKARMLNKDITILFPIELEFYKKETEINKLVKILENESIKKRIKLLVNYDDYTKNKEMVRILLNAGFELAIDFDNSSDVPYRTFNEIKLGLVPIEFIKSNESNMESWKENEVNFVIKSEINKEISELKMLGLEEN